MTVVYNNAIAAASQGSVIVTELDGAPVASAVKILKFPNTSLTDNFDGSVSIATGVGGGDVASNTTTTVDGEVALFSGVGGKIIKRNTLTGVMKSTAGVLQVATANTDYLTPPSGSAILKANAGGALANAVAGTDYLAPVMTTLGDVVYGGTSGVQTRLPGTFSTARRFLAQMGTGSASAAPFWSSVPIPNSIFYYLFDTASDVAGYKKLSSTAVSGSVITAEIAAVNGAAVTLLNFVTEPNFLSVSFIPFGTIELHIHAHQLSGTNTTTLYGELWEVNAAGVDIAMIAATEYSAVLTGTSAEHRMFVDLVNTYILASATSRICIRIKASSSGGTAATVHVEYGSTSDSHVSFPINMVDASTFLPYTGANANLNLGSHDFSSAGAVNFTLGATQQIHIDATTPRLVNKGVLRVEHVAGIEGTRPFYIDVNAAGFGNTHAVAVDFITGAQTSGNSNHVFSVNIDGAAATGGSVNGYSVDVLNVGALSNVYAVAANPGVAPLVQWVGAWTASTKVFDLVNGTGTYNDVTTGSHVIFANVNDYLYVAADAAFSQFTVALSAEATNSILPTFEYWNGAAWTLFVPLDNTTGFSDAGVVSWSETTLAGWAAVDVHGFVKYWIRIRRTSGTSATLTAIQTSAPVSYIWTKEGYLNTKTVTADTITSIVSTGTAPLAVTSTTEVANLRAAKATTLATTRAIYGNNFDGSAALTQIIASTYGGTGNGFAKFSGPTTAEKTFTLPDANATLLYAGGDLGTPSAGIATNLTGTATTLNIGGTAAIATNTTITNDAATATAVYPTWVTANTGNLPQKTTSTKLSFVPSTGVLSVTSATLAAGTTALAPLTLTSGTNLTTATAGTFEYNGARLFFTPGTVRKTVLQTACTDATPTITSGFNTSGYSVTDGNGTIAFQVTVGTGAATSSGVIGLPAAPNGWICTAQNLTQYATKGIRQTAMTTTSVTIENYNNSNGNGAATNFSNGDAILVSCIAF